VCHEYLKHPRNALDTAPARDGQSSAPNGTSRELKSREQERLYRPRRLFVKVGESWEILDGDGDQVEKPYIFISYAANQFDRELDSSSRLILTAEASKWLKHHAETVV
jgi:hypothetical protein